MRWHTKHRRIPLGRRSRWSKKALLDNQHTENESRKTYSGVIIWSYVDGCVEVIRVFDDVIVQRRRILLIRQSQDLNNTVLGLGDDAIPE